MSSGQKSSKKPLSVPARIDLKIGFACNNRCRFCVQGDKRERFGRRSENELRKILEQSRERYDGVVFTGGEPTLHPALVRLISEARRLKYRSIQIQSNGRMFAYRDLCMRLVEAGANEFSPALHGHRAELHDFLTTVEGSFEQTVAGIRNLKHLGQFIVTNSVITRSNFRHLPQLAELLVDLGVDQYQLAFVHPVGTALSNFSSIVPRFEMIEPYVKAALDVGISSDKTVMTEAIPHCFMDGYEDYIGERIMPSTRIFDAEGVIDEYRRYRLVEGKAKGPPCEKCKRDDICEGPWREYPERYGWEEFRYFKKK
ncbi:MAG: radical SAM protein [Myxococcales bacterium]|nr:radical SAM protein [Myxococcales bacterium]